MDILRAVAAFLLLLGCVNSVLAHDDGVSAQMRNIERLTDLSGNADIVRYPQKALEMADAISEPELFVAALVMSANPETWLRILKQGGKPGTLKNLAKLADPGMLVDWFYASVDPRFQRAILSRALDANKRQRWMDSMNDPRFFMPAIAVINPSTPLQWVKVAADGRLIEPHDSQPGAAGDSWLRLFPAGSGAQASTAFGGPVRRY